MINIGISLNGTKSALEHYKEVKQDVTDKFNAGNTNFGIKYFKDMPNTNIDVVSLQPICKRTGQ